MTIPFYYITTTPFYYSYIEFSKDFNHNFNEWLKHYPNGDLKRFKYEYLNLYRPFYNADDRGRIYFEVENSYSKHGVEYFNGYGLERYLNKAIPTEKHAEILLYSGIDELLNKIEKEGLKDVSVGGDDSYYNFTDDCYIFKEVFNVVIKFYSYSDYLGFYFKYNEFTDFGYSVERIVTFLLDDTKTQPEIPIQEIPQPETPQPEATEKDSLKLTEKQIFLGNGFDVFHEYMNTHILDSQLYKISFIIQKLKQEGKMGITNCKELTIWAKDNGYLDNFTYERLLIDACFLSPSKVLTKNRLKRYNELFK